MKPITKAKTFKVYLPCKTYIRKYIQTLYGETIKASLRHPLGAMLNASLEKNIYNNRSPSCSFVHKHFTDKLPIELTLWQWQKIGFEMPPQKVAHLNQFIEGMFEQHLYQWCEAGVQVGRERRLCIEQFVTLYNIDFEEDISRMGLVKMEYRFRMRVEGSLNKKAWNFEPFAA